MIVLGAGDFGAAETSGHAGLDTAGAGLRRATHRLLHGAAEGGALLELGGNAFGDELGVQVGVADLNDVDGDALADELFKIEAELLDIRTAAADHDTRTGAVDENADLRGASFDFDFRDAGGVEQILEVFADLEILDEEIADLFVLSVPSGIPIRDDADAQTVRINLLTHYFSSLSATARVM